MKCPLELAIIKFCSLLNLSLVRFKALYNPPNSKLIVPLGTVEGPNDQVHDAEMKHLPVGVLVGQLFLNSQRCKYMLEICTGLYSWMYIICVHHMHVYMYILLCVLI